MAKAASVITTKRNLLGSVGSAVSLFTTTQPMAVFSGKTIRDPLHPKNARRIIGLSFLALVAAWEEFVEAVFIRYLAGAPFPNGGRPALRVGTCSSLKHAYQVLSGRQDYDPTKHFLSFGLWKDVVGKAEIHFEHGRPFADVAQVRRDRLGDAFDIRNKVAHRSTKATDKFKRVACQHLGKGPTDNLGQGFDVGSLLLTAPARGFPGTRAPTFFEAYAQMFVALGDVLAP